MATFWLTSHRARLADLAEVAGHRVETMLSRYAHPVGESFDRIRRVVGRTRGRIQVTFRLEPRYIAKVPRPS